MAASANEEDMGALIKKYTVALFFLLLIYLVIISVKTVPTSTNESSRLQTIEALVQRHTFAISNPVAHGDLTFTGQYYYSDKPPLLSLIAAGFYALLLFLYPPAPDLLTLSPQLSYIYLTLIFSALPYLILIYLFWRSLAQLKLQSSERLIYTLALALGTPLLPFATVFSPHLLTSLLLFCGSYLLWLRPHTVSAQSTVIAGLCFAATMGLDIVLGFLALTITALYLFCRSDHRLFWFFLLGASPLFFLLVTLNVMITGMVWPPSVLIKIYGSLPENNMRYDIVFNTWQQNLKMYFSALFDTSKGLLIITPIFAFLPMVRLITQKLKNIAIWTAILSFSFLFTMLTITNDLGGSAYGLRWAIPLMPLWVWLLAAGHPSRSKMSLGLFYFLLIISIFMAFRGLPDPWQSGFDTSLWRVFTAYLSFP